MTITEYDARRAELTAILDEISESVRPRIETAWRDAWDITAVIGGAEVSYMTADELELSHATGLKLMSLEREARAAGVFREKIRLRRELRKAARMS